MAKRSVVVLLVMVILVSCGEDEPDKLKIKEDKEKNTSNCGHGSCSHRSLNFGVA